MRELFDLLWASARLALHGALVQDVCGTTLRAAVAAISGGAGGVAVLFIGGPLWLATLLGGLFAGMLAPYLLRNIKIA